MDGQKLKYRLLSKYLVTKQFEDNKDKIEEPIINRIIKFNKINRNGKVRFKLKKITNTKEIKKNKNKNLNTKTHKLPKLVPINNNYRHNNGVKFLKKYYFPKSIFIDNKSSSAVQETFKQKKTRVLKYIKQYVKQNSIPDNYIMYYCEHNQNNFVSNIKIRKTKKSITMAKNPNKLSLSMLEIDDIHPNKFIMLGNGVCHDIELLVNYVVGRYHEKENYNLDPEFQLDPIWKSKDDIKKILEHGLIKNPSKLKSKEYLYGKKSYVENTKLFKKIIYENDINKMFFNLFDTYPDFLISLNRLGTIFHIEQPTSYFNLDNIHFKDIKGVNENKMNSLIEKLVDLIKSDYMKELTDVEIKDIGTLNQKINKIITTYEYAFFSQIMEDIGLEVTHKQLCGIIENISHMMAFQINFYEGSQAKIKFIKYINSMDPQNRNVAFSLVKDIISSNDCIHRQGSRIRGIFIQWWFRYLKHYGISELDIASKYIPLTYDKKINNKTLINSKLLDKYSEDTHGYHLVQCPDRNKPCWYYKMGGIGKWDGINLNTFCFCCRLNQAPY